MHNKIKFKKIGIITLGLILGIILIICISNKINQIKISYEVEEVLEYNYFVVKEDSKYGVIDKEGTKLIDTIYDSVIIPNPSKSVFFANLMVI